jgi:hypothetical protein
MPSHTYCRAVNVSRSVLEHALGQIHYTFHVLVIRRKGHFNFTGGSEIIQMLWA